LHHKAVLAHLLPTLAAAVGRQGESRDSRFLCLKLLCDVILHFLLETDLYGAPSQQQQSQANHTSKHINDTQTLVHTNSKGLCVKCTPAKPGHRFWEVNKPNANNDMPPKRKVKAFRL